MMPKNRVRLDYNNLIENIDFLISKSRSNFAKKTGFGLVIGLELLTSYIRQIAERAIELNDDVLIGLLVDMMVLKRCDESPTDGKDGADNG